MNNKGFTLIEVLAMVVVIGILIGVSVPNITGILENQKINTLKTDARNMVETAKIKSAKLEENERPKKNQCIIYTLNYLNDEGNIKEGPHGQYYPYDSFVVYVRKENGLEKKYNYYVRLVEESGSKVVGMDLTNSEDLVNFDKTKYKENLVLYQTSDNTTDSLSKLSTLTQAGHECEAGIIKYYP